MLSFLFFAKRKQKWKKKRYSYFETTSNHKKLPTALNTNYALLVIGLLLWHIFAIHFLCVSNCLETYTSFLAYVLGCQLLFLLLQQGASKLVMQTQIFTSTFYCFITWRYNHQIIIFPLNNYLFGKRSVTSFLATKSMWRCLICTRFWLKNTKLNGILLIYSSAFLVGDAMIQMKFVVTFAKEKKKLLAAWTMSSLFIAFYLSIIGIYFHKICSMLTIFSIYICFYYCIRK